MKQFGRFDEDEYRKRVRLVRIYHGMNQTEFARFLGFDYKQWNHYERGYPMPRQAAFILREKIPGLSIDWLWFGDEGHIETGFLKRLKMMDRAVSRRGVLHSDSPRTEIVTKVRLRVSRSRRG